MKGLPRLGVTVICVASALGSDAWSKPPTGAARISCFDAAVGKNSSSTRAVFTARRCQGGGVTWAAILRVLAERHGRLAPILGPSAGMSGDVVTVNGTSRLSIDEEGDVARVCTDDPKLLGALRQDYDRINADPKELSRTMAKADSLALECLDADGRTPSLPTPNPIPSLPPAVAAATRSKLDRLKATLDQEQAWCFPENDSEERRGVLRLLPDRRATQTDLNGRLLAAGSWTWPREGSGDGRIEVLLQAVGPGISGVASLLHLDVGDSGRLGSNLIGERKITREDLIPGSACLRAR